jgi:hypothetical protein
MMIPTLFPLFIAMAIKRTDRRIRQDLTDAGATSADKAAPLTYRRSLQRRRLERLIGVGAVQVVADGRYYLDAVGWTRYRSDRRRRALIAVSVVFALGGMAFAVATLVFWRAN